MLVRELAKKWLPGLALVICAGCSRAPSIEVIGSFFPGWIFCIIGGLCLAGLVRKILAHRGLESKVGPLVVFYPSLMAGLSCLLWLVFFS